MKSLAIINKTPVVTQLTLQPAQTIICPFSGLPRAPPFRHRPRPTKSPQLCRSSSQSSPDPSYNPQNTDQPQTLPSPDFSPEQVVRIQLDALANCDEPWFNHGVQLAYEFGYDIGGLDPSMYFGFRKDLYHLDHFMGQFQTQLPELVKLTSYTIEGERDEGGEEDPSSVVTVAVKSGPAGKEQKFEFHLRRKKVGTRKGALMTEMIVRVE